MLVFVFCRVVFSEHVHLHGLVISSTDNRYYYNSPQWHPKSLLPCTIHPGAIRGKWLSRLVPQYHHNYNSSSSSSSILSKSSSVIMSDVSSAFATSFVVSSTATGSGSLSVSFCSYSIPPASLGSKLKYFSI